MHSSVSLVLPLHLAADSWRVELSELHFVETPHLRVGYEDWNPNGERVVVLWHGWPDSIRTWRQVAPVLAQAGYRVLVPALRGFLPTQFLSDQQPRTGQLAAIGRDVVEFVKAMGLERPALVGHDWGARAVANAFGLQEDVGSSMVMLSTGYGTNDPNQQLDMEQTQRYWYHWFMATPRGQATVAAQRRAFAKQMWDSWSPRGWYSPAEFDATAEAWENNDWVPVTLHSYQHRWGHAASDPAYHEDEQTLATLARIHVPALILVGDADGVSGLASSEGKAAFFTRQYERHILPGVGHFPQREAPALVARHLLAFWDACN